MQVGILACKQSIWGTAKRSKSLGRYWTGSARPGYALIGSADHVVSRIQDYRDAGIEVLIVSGMPLLEEAYRFAELVLPRLPVDRIVDDGVTSAWTKERDALWRKF